MAVEYGTIAVVPMGTWENSKDYDVGNLVELDGSSYVAKVKPPAGMLPTDTAYWQISAKGASKATVDIAGVVKPDGVTTEVDANASLSVKKATQSTVGIVKGSDDIKVGADGSIDVDTTFTQATELANIIAGEAIASVLGKVSKAIAITMSLDQNALLKNMLTSIDGNSSEKVPTQAYIHTLVERIGMGTELTAGANLTEVANKLSSNLTDLMKSYDLLISAASTTGTTQVVNVDNYREILLCAAHSSNGTIYNAAMIPTGLFKITSASSMFRCSGGSFFAQCYNANGTITASVSVDGYCAKIYGIK
ncbi:hypothetical protein HMPREF1085_02262 [Enterocloster bolteae 90A9]|uniref:Uncharacterized protein n=1 Tax=Enterocloster bolteae 90A9 TaxID=997894 RepID=R0C0X8_9FIRM|nr:hypothetical protein [Enterocloster bolteae]ENZ44619.1 hypothetical protein HMPREF1089_01215 [Enterocloster bolteae 90B3]ENZ50779.1 hypothetical protein HMPREF1085_02262 [Enterocloster bolteae 90A9]